MYDGDCRVCTRMADMLAKWDEHGDLEIMSSRQPEARHRFPRIPPSAYAESLQLVRADGKTWQGAAAIEVLLGVLPRGRWISWIFHIPFVRGVADRLYRWFARNRYKLGCRDHCRARAADSKLGPG